MLFSICAEKQQMKSTVNSVMYNIVDCASKTSGASLVIKEQCTLVRALSTTTVNYKNAIDRSLTLLLHEHSRKT